MITLSSLFDAEPWIAPVLLSIGVIGGVLSCMFFRALPARPFAFFTRVENALGRGIALLGLPLIAIVSLIPIAASWNQRPTGSLTNYSAVAGRLPWSDAAGYALGPLNLFYTGELDWWNTRRPFNVCLALPRMALAGWDFSNALLLQALLFTLFFYLCTLVVLSIFGTWSTFIFSGVMYAFSRQFLGSTLSEMLGVTLGAAACAFLLAGLYLFRFRWFCLGLFTLMLALSARAGPYFIIPLLSLAGILYFARGLSARTSAALWIVLSVTAGGSINFLLAIFYGSPEGTVNGNFAHVLLALTAGFSDWSQVSSVYGSELAALSAKEQTYFMYQKAFEIFQAHPEIFFRQFFDRIYGFLLNAPLQLRALFYPPLAGAALSLIISSLLALSALGFFLQVRRSFGITLTWLGFAAGLLLSAPIIWIDGGIRVYAAVFPLIAALLAIGVRRGSEDSSEALRTRFPARALSIGIYAVMVLAAAALLSPAALHLIADNDIAQSSCNEPGCAIIRGDTFRKNALVVSDEGASSEIPALSVAAFLSAVEGSGMEDRKTMLAAQYPAVLVQTYDISLKRYLLLIAPPAILNEPEGRYLRVTLTGDPNNLWSRTVTAWSSIP